MSDLKDEYVYELRAIVWNMERIQALEFFNEQRGLEMVRIARKTAAYKILLAKLLVRIMRILD